MIKRRYSNIYPTGYYQLVKGNGGGPPPDPGPSDLEELAIEDGAIHLYSFKPPSPFNDLVGTDHGTIQGIASRSASSIAGCQGYADIPGNLDAIQIVTTSGDWNRIGDRTLEAVFVLPTGIVADRSIFCGPGDFNDNLFIVQLLNLGPRGDSTKIFTEGNAWTEQKGEIVGIAAGEIVAVNIRFVVATGKYEIRYKVQNDATPTTHTPTNVVGSSGTGSGNFYIGGNAVIEGNVFSMPMECHHLALYDSLTSDQHFDDLLALIEI